MKEGTMKKIKKRSNDKNQIHIQNNVIKKISKTYCRVLCYYFILKKQITNKTILNLEDGYNYGSRI